MVKDSLALYVHIPYCLEKCPYCDFHSVATRGARIPSTQYIDRLVDQMKREAPEWNLVGRLVHSVYFGGGTPSLLPAKDYAKFLDETQRFFSWANPLEITLEANPATVDLISLKEFRAIGVNRISFGVQSFQGALLKRLGRVHTPRDGSQTVPLARKAGFDNINIDLIFGIESETMWDLEADLKMARSLEPTHISAYELTVEENTPLASWVAKQNVRLPGEDDLVGMHEKVSSCLAEKGWQRYEISNYASAEFECRHNLQYWRYGDFLGLGSGAVSFLHPSQVSSHLSQIYGHRWRTTRKIRDYLAGDFAREEFEPIDGKTAQFEYCMMGLRLKEGIDTKDYQSRFGSKALHEMCERFKPWMPRYLVCQDDRLAMTNAGWLISKRILQSLLP